MLLLAGFQRRSQTREEIAHLPPGAKQGAGVSQEGRPEHKGTCETARGCQARWQDLMHELQVEEGEEEQGSGTRGRGCNRGMMP